MKGYPRKTCKKAKAASLSLLCDGEEGQGLAALCEGVGGETCYPATHRLRRAGPGPGLGPPRGFCGEPQQVGDAAEITIVSSSARRALQASLIFGAPPPRLGRSPPPSVFGKHNGSHVSLPARRGFAGGPEHLGHEGDEPRAGEPAAGAAEKDDDKALAAHELGSDIGVLDPQQREWAATAAASRTTPTSFWGRFRSRLQRGACCIQPRRRERERDPSHEHEPPADGGAAAAQRAG
ncbi:Gamma-glutamyl-hercynylcysteine sulfoxide hydrolase [Frankliniella fusca]|uniref:Gamma-glutamyl-hercynylcysteine sulfoxide hydrolase n=1 Tax=Frankliniella fusca TaxID=407009 RepID=A0AAE1GUS5_9NEOP|nr:Gamma-glutamyl-hercynylcysteine sulfoxide hydrolase [Frankliniella fusca]